MTTTPYTSYPQAPPSTASQDPNTSTARNNLLAFYGDTDAANANIASGTDMSWLGAYSGGGSLYQAMNDAGYGPDSTQYGGYDAAGYNAATYGPDSAPVTAPAPTSGGTTNGGTTGGTTTGGSTGGTGGTGTGSTGSGGTGTGGTGTGTGTGSTGGTNTGGSAGSGTTGGSTGAGNGQAGTYVSLPVPETQLANAQQAQTVTTQLTPGMMSAEQLAQITSQSSPLMQRAALAGLQFANKRGLSNSSLAAQAQQAAVIDAAAPFALQDAQTTTQVGMDNTQQLNTGERFNAELGTNVNLANAAAVNDRSDLTHATNLQNYSNLFSHQLNMDTLEQQQRQEVLMQTLRGEQSVQLMEIEASYRNLLQSNQSAAAMYNSFMTTLSNIVSSTDLSSTHAQNAISSMVSTLNNGLQLFENFTNIDISAYVGNNENVYLPNSPEEWDEYFDHVCE
jgi:hypothetical protein